MNTPKRMLDLAARLALRGAGLVEPNPMVGAVIVRDGQVIGRGHHRRFGGLHAEREAIDDCMAGGGELRGATMFVTLEPCAHEGKQPPCTRAIIEAGIAHVVYAAADPHPKGHGGAADLARAGVRVDLSDESPLATGVSAPFRRCVTSGQPWVIAKWAQTIDGRVATRTGESRWISGDGARRRVHQLRARVDAIITGIGTAVADDPMLTARGVRVRRTARRVVADNDLDLPLDSALVRSAREVPLTIACLADLVGSGIMKDKQDALERAGVEILGVPHGVNAHRLDPRAMLRLLHERHGVSTAMLEAGPGLTGAFLEADLIDEARVYVAPMMLGDELAASVAVGRVAESLRAGKRFDLWRVKPIGGDVEITYRRPGV
ncbi:MAG: bifunctional diaminohydroxyphosphoribosylaminopyrimidine deaminase/5-amino-6-(5-phosphoribosylamino)uracil reductase RibD [Phycisphaerales bacterium]|nr:bifunctional diaminohydroxyphosphoribosylaminopyrimidine deaminase/5-amino-6-(5-phosphoribosylamino)uracil reductase RibD [Phycisphaerales bacterium]